MAPTISASQYRKNRYITIYIIFINKCIKGRFDAVSFCLIKHKLNSFFPMKEYYLKSK